MKKALVLGVLAFFAINIATVQNMNAQNKKATKATVKDAKTEEVQSPVKPKTAKMDTPKTAKAAEVKEAKADVKESKACCNEAEKKDCKSNMNKTAEPKKVTKADEKDPTVKQVKKEKPAVGVPPTPKKTKETGAKKANANTPATR